IVRDSSVQRWSPVFLASLLLAGNAMQADREAQFDIFWSRVPQWARLFVLRSVCHRIEYPTSVAMRVLELLTTVARRSVQVKPAATAQTANTALVRPSVGP